MQEHSEPLEVTVFLGSGGFAQTWRARVIDPDLLDEWKIEDVAIKIPLCKEKQRSIKKDIELIGSLHTQLTEVEAKNIVKYLGFCIYEGKIVMVMNYIAGGSLRNLMGKIGQWKKIEPEKAITIACGILEGLSIIHKKRIIHRDIKPENILMEGDIPKITDFGISKILKTEEVASTIIGTPFYMSPELLYGKASYNTDIWSFGITFYEMLYGQFPFGIKGKNQPYGEIIDIIKDENLDLLFPDEPVIPLKLQKIISKCLIRNPDKRYRSAEEVIKDIKELNDIEDNIIDKVEEEIGLIQDLLFDRSRTSAVEKELNKILEKYPHSSRIYLHFGEFYNRCGLYNKAIDMFKKGIAKAPDESMLLWGLAMAYNKNQNFKRAISYLERALDTGLEASLERYGRVLLKTLQQKGDEP